MSLGERAGTILVVFLAAAVLLMVIGQLLGQPILFGYVATGSMSPTLEAGDGFVAVPPEIAGEIQSGDVITYDAHELHDGGLTTHRVVESTEEGYITRGDANPFTDQSGDEPPVTDGQIAAIVLQINGEVVRIPHLGTVVLGVQGVLGTIAGVFGFLPGMDQLAEGNVGVLMVGFGLVLLAASVLTDLASGARDRTGRSRKRRGVLSPPVLLAIILLLILVPMSASMMIPSGAMELGIVSSQSPSEDPTVIGVGESQDIEYTFTNEGYVPKVVVLEPASPGVAVSETVIRVGPGQQAETTVTVTAPEETGFYLRHLSERHYLHLLPSSMLIALHTIHPWIVLLVLNTLVAAIVAGIFIVSIGFEPLRLRDTKRDIPLTYRIRRTIQRWF